MSDKTEQNHTEDGPQIETFSINANDKKERKKDKKEKKLKKNKTYGTIKIDKDSARRHSASTTHGRPPPENSLKETELEQLKLAVEIANLSKDDVKDFLLGKLPETTTSPSITVTPSTDVPADMPNLEDDRSNRRKSTLVLESDPDTRDKMRFEVINEIVTTEKIYVKDLELVISVFLQPLKKTKVLNDGDLKNLFSNVEAILNINSVLNKGLQDSLLTTKMQDIPVGEILFKSLDFLKIYTVYSSNYETALQTYERLTKDNKEFVNFLKECQEKPECKGMNLPAFLIKPVQKICKYPLLMKELLRNTPPTHPDHEHIENCYRKTQQIAEYVNDKKRKIESLQKMIEIRDKLVDVKNFTLITPSRAYVREGLLGKVNNYGKLQDRYFFLFTDVLVYTAPQIFKKNYQFKGAINLYECMVSELKTHEKYKYAFTISRFDSKKKYIVNFTSEKEKQSWFSDVQAQIEEILKKRSQNDKLLQERRKTLKHSHSTPRIKVTGKSVTNYDEIRKQKMTQGGTADLQSQVILSVKTPDVTVSTRVSVSSTVEAVINKLKLKLPDEVDSWKLFYDGKCLDDPTVTLNSIEKIGNLIGANKNLETVEMEFKP